MKKANQYLILLMLSGFAFPAKAQHKKATDSKVNYISKVWVADQGDGTYKNPVLNADYSDPDAIRVGDDFYLISSSFTDIPGLPVLHSKDLVNWEIIGHALLRQPPYDHYNIPRHGDGVWAPSIRYYNHEFCIYYPDINYGIYLIKAKNPAGPWSEPLLVYRGLGLEDPCPLIDDDGKMYMVHAFAGSKAGIKSVIAINKMNADGTKVIDTGVIVYDGHKNDPTIEGPKFHKRNGYYYIFAPAGGVSTGWQVVLRSKNIYGPYERKVVMDQGKSNTNGPHQGAWVDTQTGEDWFLHFQDKKAYGRVVHLEPMQWVNGWPVIGVDNDHDGKGEPVAVFRKPNVGKSYPLSSPPESDEFNSGALGMQWQWSANSQESWYRADSVTGRLRLFAQALPENAKNLYGSPNLLLQKFPAEEFVVTTKLSFIAGSIENERGGLTIMGKSYAAIAVKSKKDGLYLVYSVCDKANKGNLETETIITKITGNDIYLRVVVSKGASCIFSYSTDGRSFKKAGGDFTAETGHWIGAKVGLFCTGDAGIVTGGHSSADFDWFHVTSSQ